MKNVLKNKNVLESELSSSNDRDKEEVSVSAAIRNRNADKADVTQFFTSTPITIHKRERSLNFTPINKEICKKSDEPMKIIQNVSFEEEMGEVENKHNQNGNGLNSKRSRGEIESYDSDTDKNERISHSTDSSSSEIQIDYIDHKNEISFQGKKDGSYKEANNSREESKLSEKPPGGPRKLKNPNPTKTIKESNDKGCEKSNELITSYQKQNEANNKQQLLELEPVPGTSKKIKRKKKSAKDRLTKNHNKGKHKSSLKTISKNKPKTEKVVCLSFIEFRRLTVSEKPYELSTRTRKHHYEPFMGFAANLSHRQSNEE